MCVRQRIMNHEPCKWSNWIIWNYYVLLWLIIACFSIWFALASLSALEMHGLSSRSSNASSKILWSGNVSQNTFNVQFHYFKRTVGKYSGNIKNQTIERENKLISWSVSSFAFLFVFQAYLFLVLLLVCWFWRNCIHISHIESEHSNVLRPIEIILPNKSVGYFKRCWCNQ